MNQEDATKVALRALEEEAVDSRPLSLYGPVLETDRAWIFSYQSKRWVETGGSEDLLYGAGPVYVDKRTGRADFLGTYSSRDVVIRDYERHLDKVAAEGEGARRGSKERDE